jgi:hypothetical protein
LPWYSEQKCFLPYFLVRINYTILKLFQAIFDEEIRMRGQICLPMKFSSYFCFSSGSRVRRPSLPHPSVRALNCRRVRRYYVIMGASTPRTL